MVQKKYDGHGRWRNRHVTFHMSDEEIEELNRAVAMSGLTKQEYLINRVLNRDITVIPNSRVYKLLLEQTKQTVLELKQAVKSANEIDPYLRDTVLLIINTFEQMKGKKDE